MGSELTADSCFSSPMFQFQIGPNAKTFNAHAEKIASCSPALQREIFGELSEAQAGVAVVQDVDEDTFVRFLNFAYTKSYDPDSYTLHTKDELFEGNHPATGVQCSNCDTQFEIEESETEVCCSSCDHTQTLRSRVERPPYPDSKLWKEFKAFQWGSIVLDDSPRINTNHMEDYTPVFLSHARLYIFADKYLVSELMHLTLAKLHQTLASFSLWEEGVNEVMVLARHVYQNTPDRPGVDDMRSLIAYYIACYIEKFAEAKDFQSLLEEDSTLGKDLVLLLRRRIES